MGGYLVFVHSELLNHLVEPRHKLLLRIEPLVLSFKGLGSRVPAFGFKVYGLGSRVCIVYGLDVMV